MQYKYDKIIKQDINTNELNDILEHVNKEINFNLLLDKYGPRGLYLIADKLKNIADEDMRNALNQYKFE